MKCEVATELWMSNRVSVATAFINGVNGLHTSIETDDEEIEVHAQAYTIGHSDLFVETAESELTTGLVFIVA